MNQQVFISLMMATVISLSQVTDAMPPFPDFERLMERPIIPVQKAQSRTGRTYVNANANAKLNSIWMQFKQTPSKEYETEEHEKISHLVFDMNVVYIEKHNREYDLGQHTYTLESMNTPI